MKSLKLFGAAVSLTFLSGCGAHDIQSLRGIATPAGGNGFTQALTKEYRDLTLFEADKMMDWTDAYAFAAKGLAASRGETVLPETTDRWSLSAGKKTELDGARSKLMAALESGKTRLPDIAARAQVAYDCWVEQEEEAWQTADIAHCKALFDSMLAQLNQGVVPAASKAAATAPIAQRNHTVYFAWDSARIDRAGEAVIDQAASEAKRTGSSRLTVVGHADRSGAEDYNVRLSLRRAEAVRAALVKRGISADRSSVTALGETDPAVPTADGAKEPRNRRVEINIR